MKKKIKMNKFIETLKLKVLFRGDTDILTTDTSDVVRPGLQMTGFFEHFSHSSVQLFGMSEMTYIDQISHERRLEIFEKYFSYPLPCVLISRDIQPPEDFLSCAEKHNITVLSSAITTTKLSHSVMTYLDGELAPLIARHGGLMDIFGVGVYITGDSGVGKSEAALELIKRGHRLIADDVVEIRKVTDNELLGSSPEVIRHLMEIRGVGLIDISVLYGMGSVMASKYITLNINLELGNPINADRLGIQQEYITLLGIDVPKISIPVMPGRNIAAIIEVAVKNFRLKSMGYNPADTLNQKLLNLLG